MRRVLQYLSSNLFNNYSNRAIIVFVSVFSFCLPVFAQTSWNKLTFPTNENLYMVRFASADTGWVVGANFVYKTDDGGHNWIQQDISGACEALCVLNSMTAIYSSDYTRGIRRTNDGGQTWNTVDTSKFYYTGIKFINSQLGFATGYETPGVLAIIKRTTDGGETWKTISSFNIGNYQLDFEGVSFTDSLNGWAVTYRGSIYNTTDGGFNWSFQDSVQQSPPYPFPGVPFRDIQVIPGGKGWVVGGIASFSQIGITTNGMTWPTKLVINNSLTSLCEIQMLNADTGYVAGTNSGPLGVGKTTDGGLTWTNELGTSRGFYSISIIGDSVGYAVGDAGSIYKMTIGTTTSLSNKTTHPATFLLMQNYPNPFNPATIIRYTIPETGFVKLGVFNALGQEIKTLVKEVQTAGEHSIVFDAGKLSAGIYFYRIQTGTYSQTKKLILLK